MSEWKGVGSCEAREEFQFRRRWRRERERRGTYKVVSTLI